MRITILDLQSGDTDQFETESRHITVGSDSQNDLIQSDVAAFQLVIRDDSLNVTVTRLESGYPTFLTDTELRPGIPMVWLPEQELVIGEQIVLHQLQRVPLAGAPRPPRLEVRRWIPPMVVMAVTILLFGLLLRVFTELRGAVLRTASIPAAPTITATVTITPTQAPTLTARLLAVAVLSPLITTTRVDRPTPIPTPSITATHSVTGVGVAALVTEKSRCTPEWVPNRAWFTPTLGIDFQPADIIVGQEFWQLARVEYVTDTIAAGRHNIYVDVRDEEGKQRLTDINVIVSWAGGQCIRETKDISNRHDEPWSDYGANCPMMAAGYVYSVSIDKGPSDRLLGLGLGSPQYRELPILVSYLLEFRRKKSNC